MFATLEWRNIVKVFWNCIINGFRKRFLYWLELDFLTLARALFIDYFFSTFMLCFHIYYDHAAKFIHNSTINRNKCVYWFRYQRRQQQFTMIAIQYYLVFLKYYFALFSALLMQILMQITFSIFGERRRAKQWNNALVENTFWRDCLVISAFWVNMSIVENQNSQCFSSH